MMTVPAPKKYPQGFRERAMRLVQEAREQDPELSQNELSVDAVIEYAARRPGVAGAVDRVRIVLLAPPNHATVRTSQRQLDLTAQVLGEQSSLGRPRLSMEARASAARIPQSSTG